VASHVRHTVPEGTGRPPFAVVASCNECGSLCDVLRNRGPSFPRDATVAKQRHSPALSLPVHTLSCSFSPSRNRVSFIGLSPRWQLVSRGVWFAFKPSTTPLHLERVPKDWRTLADRGVAPRLFDRHFAGTSTANCGANVPHCLAVVNSRVQSCGLLLRKNCTFWLPSRASAIV